ncbi:MAG: GatB/YqeY domain-containing protein [Patescibacteria group bacterium]
MNLITSIEADLLAALKAGDDFTKETLRFLKSIIKNAEIDTGKPLDDQQVTTIIQREVKKRVEAEAIYRDIDKIDLADKEYQEMMLLKKYLPEQMDEATVIVVVEKYLKANPTEMSQMGQAMGALSAELKGQADMSLVSQILRQKIQNG